MRHSEQLPLTAPWISHIYAAELTAIRALLDQDSRIAALVEQDLLHSCLKNAHTGRPRLTGNQVIRIVLVRQMNSWTYTELAFHLADSVSYGAFCRVGSLSRTPSKSAVAANLRKLRPETLHEINQLIVLSAARLGIERGQRVRINSTVVEAWVHAPTDSLLLFDGVRVFLRLLRRAEHLVGFTAYHRHLKRAKRRLMEIQHLPPQATRARKRAYRDLIILAQATIGYAACALEELSGQLRIPSQSDAHQWQLKPFLKLYRQLAHYISLVKQVIEQTTRRVLQGESVPATEKGVSLFEPHTDVLVKDRRETYYGHRIFLTGGTESVISLLKRAFGLDRCTWKGAMGFVAYVRMGVLTANLVNPRATSIGLIPIKVPTTL